MNAQPNTRAPEYEEADRKTAPQAIRATNRAARAPRLAGRHGHNVRYVLGFSLAAILVAFLAVYLIFV